MNYNHYENNNKLTKMLYKMDQLFPLQWGVDGAGMFGRTISKEEETSFSSSCSEKKPIFRREGGVNL